MKRFLLPVAAAVLVAACHDSTDPSTGPSAEPLDQPAGPASEAITATPATTVRHLWAVVAANGTLTRGSRVTGVTRLGIGRYEVTVPGCPDWRKTVVTDFSNKESTNLGCANAMNLALMLADPGDLMWGDPLTGADGQREAGVIDRYRAGTQPRVANPDLPSAQSTKSLTGN